MIDLKVIDSKNVSVDDIIKMAKTQRKYSDMLGYKLGLKDCIQYIQLLHIKGTRKHDKEIRDIICYKEVPHVAL